MKITVALITVVSIMLSITQAGNTETIDNHPTIRPNTFSKKIQCLEACAEMKGNRNAVYYCIKQCRPYFPHDISIEAAEYEKKLLDYSYHDKEWSDVFPEDH